MPSFNCVERRLSIYFHVYGRFVTNHPMPFIIFPLILTFAMSLCIIKVDPITDAIYLFTPIDAPSKIERQVIHDLWPLTNGSYIPGRAVTQSREVQITVFAKDDANILVRPYSEAVYRLDSYIQNRIHVTVDNKTYGYKDLCLAYKELGCLGNKHVNIISDLYQHGFNVTYPTVRFGSQSGYIGSSLGGVSVTYGKNNELVLASAKAWLMIYHLQFYPENVSYISGIWEKEFQRAMESYSYDPYIRLTYFHSQTLAEELRRNADSLIPRFIVAFTILVIFSVVCSISTIDGTVFIDWVLSKPILAVFGCLNAGMGIATAVGTLIMIGVRYNDIVGVMPFLVVAVGVDNMFLMIAAVRRTNRAHSTTDRMGDAMSDAAMSIFITSMTDAFSFGIGTMTSIPAVRIFCIYTAMALIFTFIYQVTFFCALLSLATKWESMGLHCIFLKPTIPENFMSSANWVGKFFWLGTRSDPNPKNLKVNMKESAASYFFQNWYAPVLMQPIIRGLAIVWYFIYITFAVYGCLQLREGLEPVNLLVEDSYAIPHYRVLEHYFWHYGAAVQIVVNHPPDLRTKENRLKIKSMVHTFANTRHTIGDESVQFWMEEMERYYNKELEMEVVDDSFYLMVQHFMAAKSQEFWPEDVKWGKMEDGTVGITAFRFIVGMRDIVTTVEQQDATVTLREVAARYPSYNITTFMPLWLFTDQYALVVPNTVQNTGIAMGTMIIIALILIPQPMCALWVSLSIASIDVGVVGYMTLWGVNLDAISMITIIMSVGFSVDYTAHITYGYVISKQTHPRKRISEALGGLGWPVVQGAISTILAVSTLANVPAYMIVTFFKTVFLAISIGLLHGLVFLPVILSLFVRELCFNLSQNSTLKKKKKTEQRTNLADFP